MKTENCDEREPKMTTKRSSECECPKCGRVICPVVLEFIKGADQVMPPVPDRNHVTCPVCSQNFYVTADTGERTDGKAVLERQRANAN